MDKTQGNQKLENLKTWDELHDYLLDRMTYATNKQSNANKSFTKEQIWNSLIGQCNKYTGQELPIRTKHLLLKTVSKDFNI